MSAESIRARLEAAKDNNFLFPYPVPDFDLALAAHAPTDLRLLLAVAEAAKARRDAKGFRDLVATECDLWAALDALEAES